MHFSFVLLSIIFVIFLGGTSDSKYANYILNEQNKYEPEMLAISSTVISIPIYKVDTQFGNQEGYEETDPHKLITVNNKRKSKSIGIPGSQSEGQVLVKIEPM